MQDLSPIRGRADRNLLSFQSIVLLVALVIIGHSPEPSFAQSAPAALHGEFTIGKQGRLVLLPVHIADREILCLLDTGASLSAFDVTLRPLLGNSQSFRLLESPGSRIRVETYAWPHVTLGDQPLRSPKPVICIDLEGLRQATNQPVYGVIGMDSLQSSLLQIDFDRGTLKFLERLPALPRRLGTRIPIQFKPDGTPHLVASIGATRPVEMLIDTGAQGNSLAEGVFDELSVENRIRIGSTYASVTIAGDVYGKRGRLDRLILGAYAHDDLRVARTRLNSLGLRYFSRFKLTLDFSQGYLYLLPGEHFDRPEPKATSGLMLKWIEGVAHVDSLRDNGPAKNIGMAPGDVLVAVDGVPAAEFDPFSLRELLTSEGGQTVRLTLLRNERSLDFTIRLDAD